MNEARKTPDSMNKRQDRRGSVPRGNEEEAPSKEIKVGELEFLGDKLENTTYYALFRQSGEGGDGSGGGGFLIFRSDRDGEHGFVSGSPVEESEELGTKVAQVELGNDGFSIDGGDHLTLEEMAETLSYRSFYELVAFVAPKSQAMLSRIDRSGKPTPPF